MSEILTILTDKNLAQSGYQELPGGLILQWGRANGGTAAAVEGSFTFAFPKPFPNACFSFVPTDYASGNSTLCIVGAGAGTTATTAEVYWRSANGASTANPGVVCWVAIGN